MATTLIDSASCTVFVYPNKVLITDIKNYPPTVIKEAKQNYLIPHKIYTNEALGIIHLTESSVNFSLSNDYPPEVYFELTPDTILVYKLQFSAGGGVRYDRASVFGVNPA